MKLLLNCVTVGREESREIRKSGKRRQESFGSSSLEDGRAWVEPLTVAGEGFGLLGTGAKDLQRKLTSPKLKICSASVRGVESSSVPLGRSLIP